MDLSIIQFDPETASREEWRQYHTFRRARHVETNPEDPVIEDETMEAWMRWRDPQWEEIRHAVLDPEGPEAQIGYIHFEISRPGSPSHETNKNLASINVELLRPYRRRAYGHRMLVKVVELAREHARNVLQGSCGEEDGKAFAAAIGAKVVLRGREVRLNLDEVDWAMVEAWAKEGAIRSPGTTLRWFVNRIDDDIIDLYCRLYTDTSNQEPQDEATHGDVTFTPETFRDREARLAEIGGRELTVVSVEPNGDLSGLTEMTHVPDRKWMIRQNTTGVRDVYRGRGLGKWLKAEMLLRVRREFPHVKVVVTGNASSNQAMLSINERLGFRTHKEPLTVEMTREALEGYLRDHLRTRTS